MLSKKFVSIFFHFFINRFPILSTKGLYFLILPVALFVFTSCEDPKDIGLNLSGGGGQISTNFTDTISVNAYTMLIDSAITSGRTEVLAGNYTDPIFGSVETKSFFQANLPTSTVYTSSFDNYDIKSLITDATIDVVYDSAGVYIGYNKFNYGKDTLQDLTLTLYPLIEAVNTTSYTADKSVKYDESMPLATKKITIRDLKNVSGDTTRSIRFVLPQSFGKKLFELSGTMASEIDFTDAAGVKSKVKVGDNDKFHQFLQGFALVAKRGPNVVYSFNLSPSSSYLYMAYHRVRKGVPLNTSNIEVTDSTQYLTTVGRYYQSFVFSGGRFSQIKVNRQSSPITKITQPLVPIPASQTAGKTYLQTGLGITTKIKINEDALRNLLKSGSVIINKAELVFSTVTDSLNNFEPPSVMGLIELDKTNRFVRNNGYYTYVPDDENGVAVKPYSAIGKRYKYNITTYIQDLLNGKRAFGEQALSAVSQIAVGSSNVWLPRNTTIARAVFDKGSIKLNIYYSKLN